MSPVLKVLCRNIDISLRYLCFVSFDRSIPLFGLILTSLEKRALFWRFSAEMLISHWDIFVFVSFYHSIPLFGLISNWLRKMSPVLKVSCRNIDILLRYLWISMFLHETFRTGFIFLSRWNETKQWYATIETYKNINISVGYQCFCMKPSEQGSFFQAGSNESKQWYGMIETYKNINISVGYQHFCMKPSEQGLFFWAGQNESKQWYAMIETYKNINISVGYQRFCMKPSEQGMLFRASRNESK